MRFFAGPAEYLFCDDNRPLWPGAIFLFISGAEYGQNWDVQVTGQMQDRAVIGH